MLGQINRNQKFMRNQKKIISKNSNSFVIEFVVLISLLLISITQINAQTDLEQIIKVRKTSNEALKSFNNELSYTVLTDDVMITTGNGTLINGKEEYRKYDNEFDSNTMYWIRTTDELELNMERGLAWESGIWKGYDIKKGSNPIINGKYSAMWTKETGEWKIKSQLFVTLNNN